MFATLIGNGPRCQKSVPYVAMNPLRKTKNANLHLIGLPLSFNQHHKLPPHVKRTRKIRAPIRRKLSKFYDLLFAALPNLWQSRHQKATLMMNPRDFSLKCV
ncbi:hypothetical protein NPIL_300491 [Nephila pilipes]|uniref:Uncharacterized protein n=1 Tax=Nephila pilipes TaxID=299642 RepID=A0A8X6QJ76_NEPPI|nr:hypothetical protein NPIL_300491 [Nephila pilipes]